jgi:hypothetical protein
MLSVQEACKQLGPDASTARDPSVHVPDSGTGAMTEDAFGGLTTLLALVGAAALVYRSIGGIFRLVLRASQETAAVGMAEVSASRGDVTGMLERQRLARAARQDRWRHSLLTITWILWLTLPMVLGGARIAYALASVLWILPTSRPTPRS